MQNSGDGCRAIADNAEMATEEPEAEVTLEEIEAVMTERHTALGLVIDMAGSLEYTLTGVFCALVGSKFAIVVAAGQSADWLIGNCRSLARVHYEMTDEQRAAIVAALDMAAEASRARNTLVHANKSGSAVPGGRLFTIKAKRGSHLWVSQSWTPAEIRDVAMKLARASGDLRHAIEVAMGQQVMAIGDALAWEEQRRAESAGLQESSDSSQT